MRLTPSAKARVFAGTDRARIAAAKAAGLRVKLHADQLSNLPRRAPRAEHNALSADHLEYTDEEGAAAMARAGTVAVLLPGAFYMLREETIAAGRYVAPAQSADRDRDDSNPGTSPIHLAAHDPEHGGDAVRLTVDECIAGRNARCGARARAPGTSARSRRANTAISRSGHRAPGRTRLSHRLQSAARPGAERPMILTPGKSPGKSSAVRFSRRHDARRPQQSQRRRFDDAESCALGAKVYACATRAVLPEDFAGR